MNKLALALILLPSLAGAREVTTRVVLTPGRLHDATLAMDGFTRNTVPGQPGLPERDVAVALHPRADLSTLSIVVKSGPTDSLSGRRSIAPNPPLTLLWPDRATHSWVGAGTVVDGRDVAAYAADRKVVFPRDVVRRGNVTNRRGLLVLHLTYTPLRYRHAAGELLLDKHTELELRYRLKSNAPYPPDPQLLPFLGRVVNPAQARLWHQAGRADTTTPPGYAIVIEDKLRQASQALDAFTKQKEKLGFKVYLVTDKDRAAISVDVTCDPKQGPVACEADRDAERIRAWLQQNYKTLNLRYVLLIGNPDPEQPGVPMKQTYANIGSDSSQKGLDSLDPATDHYYADLTGNWDLDGDGHVAQYPDDDDGGTFGVDFVPEVYVGRIPVYGENVAALDTILKKTMRYLAETGERAWRKRVLQPAAIYWYPNENNQHGYGVDGGTMADIINEQVLKPHGFSRFTLYEAEGVAPSKLTCDAALTTENVVAEWKKGYGLVTWFGHGSESGVFRSVWTADKDSDGVPDSNELSMPPYFTYDDTIALDDTHPAFVFHGSCENAAPTAADNVSYGLLRHGAIGSVGATVNSVVIMQTYADPANTSILGAERHFTEGLLDNKPASEALFYAKDKLTLKLGMYSWLIKLQLNLYGDPSVALTSCATDADCDDGKACNGTEVCQSGQCSAGEAVSCSSFDPCMEASCDEQTGKCSVRPRPNGEPCDDGKFCTVGEVCNGGQCVGQARCAAPNNPCVAAKCDEAAKTCDVFPQIEGETCHEGSERHGTCRAGICEPDGGGCNMGGGGGSPLALLLLLLACAPGLVASARRTRGGRGREPRRPVLRTPTRRAR